MKRIYFVRHAKSSWDNAGQEDYFRPILPVGLTRTKLITDFLLQKNVVIELLISSHATRAIQTATLIAEALEYPIANMQQDRAIYEQNENRILELIYGLPETIESVMIVGHNPAITDLSNVFAKEKISNMPTSALFAVEIDTLHWTEIHTKPRKTLFYIYPKMLLS